MKIQADTTFWLVVAAVIGFGIWFGRIKHKLAVVEKNVGDYYIAVSMARAECESSYRSNVRAIS